MGTHDKNVVTVHGQPVKTLALDLHAVSSFCFSVGVARAMAETSELKWERHALSGTLKVLYALMPWKEPPGAAVFDVAPAAKLYELAYQYAHDWQEKLLLRFHKNPAQGQQYAANLYKIRQSHLETVQMRARAASMINQDVDKQLSDAIKGWATVKLAGTVGLAAIGLAAGIAAVASVSTVAAGPLVLNLGAPGLAFTGVGLAFNLLLTNIPSFDAAGTAQCVVGVGLQEGLSKGVDVQIEKLHSRIAYTQELMRKAEAQIDELSRRLAQEAWSHEPSVLKMTGYTEEYGNWEKQRVVDTIVGSKKGDKSKLISYHKEELQKQQGRLNFYKGAAKCLPVIFFAYDVWQALQSFAKDWQAGSN